MARYFFIGCTVAFIGFGALLAIPFGMAFVIGFMAANIETAQHENITVYYSEPVSEQDAGAVARTLSRPTLLGTADLDFDFTLSKENEQFTLQGYVGSQAKNDIEGVQGLYEYMGHIVRREALKKAPLNVEVYADQEVLFSLTATDRLGTPVFRDRHILLYTDAVTETTATAAEQSLVELGIFDPATCPPGVILFVDQVDSKLVVGVKGNEDFLATFETAELDDLGNRVVRGISLIAWNGGQVEFSYTTPNARPLQGMTWEFHLITGPAFKTEFNNVEVLHGNSVSEGVAKAIAEQIAALSDNSNRMLARRDGDAYRVDVVCNEGMRERNDQNEALAEVIGREIAKALPENGWLTMGVADKDLNRLWSLPIEWDTSSMVAFDHGAVHFTNDEEIANAERLAQSLNASGWDSGGVDWDIEYELRDGEHWIQLAVHAEAVNEESLAYFEPVITSSLAGFDDEVAYFELVDINGNLGADYRWTNQSDAGEVPVSTENSTEASS
ncbi:MAG: hypothetical protein AAGG44_06270, partial [Planctomycetota bacterium]